ncbi:hypothetical protein PoB_002935800 [Plakobranchus ocellatus]|uniref:Uncharacterized protein n=1 Tax=Plakobranchus ocellatus TaxID=259542 RepID=A0AAV4A7Z6_9GAST|nr:hypothetical protein PoB_002935800 [Plakobranchus ocellatus]
MVSAYSLLKKQLKTKQCLIHQNQPSLASTLYYIEVPRYYIWNNKSWKRRRRGTQVEDVEQEPIVHASDPHLPSTVTIAGSAHTASCTANSTGVFLDLSDPSTLPQLTSEEQGVIAELFGNQDSDIEDIKDPVPIRNNSGFTCP